MANQEVEQQGNRFGPRQEECRQTKVKLISILLINIHRTISKTSQITNIPTNRIVYKET
jgi:hypothetical protein